MSHKPNKNVSKLPQWAQDKISELEHQLEADKKWYTDKVDALSAGEDAQIVVDPYFSDYSIGFTEGTIIRFYLGNRKENTHTYIDVRLSEDLKTLKVNCGDGQIFIQPQSANRFEISGS